MHLNGKFFHFNTDTLFHVFQHYGMKFKNWQELTSERKARDQAKLGTFLLFSLYPFSSPFVKSLERLRDSVEMKDLTHLF